MSHRSVPQARKQNPAVRAAGGLGGFTKFLRKLYLLLSIAPERAGKVGSMKNLKPLRILTVVFAVTMMAAYVVYSRQQTRVVAPGSKAGVLQTGLGPAVPAGATNQAAPALESVFASSSKSMAPLLKVPAPGQTAQPAARPPIAAAPIAATNINPGTAITNQAPRLKPAS